MMALPININEVLNQRPAATWGILLAVLVAGYALSTIIYNLFFSPLRNIPGPKLFAISPYPYAHLTVSGNGHKRIQRLHEKYGPVVRTAPNAVAFNDPRAWKDTMGHRRHEGLENVRDPAFYDQQGPGLIGTLSSEEHGRQRRILSHGFSAQTMMEQQPLIQQYVDSLMQGLRENCQDGTKALDVTKWYNWTTFDVIGDLSFGESFGCLEGSRYHPWVSVVFQCTKQTAFLMALRLVFPRLERFVSEHFLDIVTDKRQKHAAFSNSQVAKRMANEEERPDFMHHLMSKDKDGQNKLTVDQIRSTANSLIVAGSETTATALSGATYLLCENPDALAKLTAEVRSSFASEDEITLLSVQKLKYMLAVLDETLRMFPPVPTHTPRIVHKGGATICDTFLPEDTTVQIWHWPMYRSAKHFALPNSFIPERWLGDARFANDRKESFEPFNHGPRNCVGKNLAYAEMRLILARIIWNFDMKLAEGNENWIDKNSVYIIWQKEELNVYLLPRKMGS